MKVTNVLKNVSLGVLVTMLIGCSSVTRVATVQIKAKSDGVLYGLSYQGGVYNPTADIKEICIAIENKDTRCAEPEKYGSLAIISHVGFSDGFMGAVAVYDKTTINPGPGCNSLRTEASANKACTFYRVKVEPSKLATIVDVASSPTKDTGNCKWDGVNGWGGAVCSTYNWDYRKDGKSMVKFDVM